MSMSASRSPLRPTPSPSPLSGAASYGVSPLPELAHPLSEEDVRRYREDGFVVVRNLITAEEAAFFRGEADRVANDVRAMGERHGLDPACNMRFEIAGESAWKVDPVVDVSPEFAALTRDRRITDRLASLYDGYPARLFKDKLILKPGHTHGNDLHQDYNWWQGFPQSCLSVTIALDETNRANGCTRLWAMKERRFLHDRGSLQPQLPREAVEGCPETVLELQPGDAAIFHCLTPHAADANSTDKTRCVLFLSYNDSRDGEWRQAHYEHFWWYRTARLSAEERERTYVL